MSEDKWLWNQPKAWHDTDRALKDISVLLAYLGAMPDCRLLGYFADTQGRAKESSVKATVPPCTGYAEFLNTLDQIGSAFETGRPDLLPRLPACSERGAPLSATGFVFWSRDFLAAVAAPATADSIRLTQDYIIRRVRTRGLLCWLQKARAKTGVAGPTLPGDGDDVTRKLMARRLARWVQTSEVVTIGVVVLTVAISIYALSGRLILGNAASMEEAWSALDTQLEAQEDRLMSSATLPVESRDLLAAAGLCNYEKEAGREAEKTGFLRKAAEGYTALALAAPQNTSNDASSGLITPSGMHPSFISARQIHLCADSAKVLLNLFTVTMHLQTWSSVVTERIGEGWSVNLGGHRLGLTVPLAPLLGVSYQSITEYAEDRGGGLCKQVAPDIYDDSTKADGCRKLLLTMINKTHRVAESILGSITQYILPVCYGFLGAMAATLRMIRRKVDACLLSYTDRSRIQQGAILGILCGGVIGLFASYVGRADAASGLGLSAVALLAGYNVDGVFRFLDELSDRIFRPSAAPKA